jgi:hypothetical protein
MAAPSDEKLICDKFNLEALTVNQVKSFKALADGPPLADLEYILRIRALIFHWLRLPVHVSNRKTFYTEHMLSMKCK